MTLPPWTASNDDPHGPCPFRHLVSPEIEIRRGMSDGVEVVELHWVKRKRRVVFPAKEMDGLSVEDVKAQLLEPASRRLHQREDETMKTKPKPPVKSMAVAAKGGKKGATEYPKGGKKK